MVKTKWTPNLTPNQLRKFNREAKAASRARLTEMGMCVINTAHKATKGMRTCQECRDRVQEYRRAG
jgi:hypothetical protein